MDWFYAEGTERRGPIAETELQSLISSGRVTAETRVWNHTMKDWMLLRETGFAGVPPLPGGTQQRCFITGRLRPTSEMIETEHGWVSAEARDTYYQCLRESVPFPVPDGASNARADGKRIVVARNNPVLPQRCVKTNAPVLPEQVNRKKLYWAPSWIALLLLLNVLILLIVYFIVRKGVMLDIPLSGEGRAMVRKNAGIGLGIAALGLALVVTGIAKEAYVILILPGVVATLVGIIYAAFKGSTLRIAKLTTHEVWLTGASAAFLASLPPYARKS
jgi:hypothetical protein